MDNDEPSEGSLPPFFFGRMAGFLAAKKTFWDDERVKHDPADTDSKDWANSEPDPDAP
jgi:hypothetical protein